MRKPLIFAITLPLITATSLQAHAEKWFQTPSKNITCMGDYAYADGKNLSGVMCEIVEVNNKPIQPKPKSCNLDWGQRFHVGKTGKANLTCYSDSIQGAKQTLNYGQTIKGNGWQCTSKPSGMLCKNTSGHGFSLNKNSQKLF